MAVSEAVSTLRLRYGEGGRFRFLAGALLAPRAAIALRLAGISFLNAFLKSAPHTQTGLYIQAEACEAGLEPRVLQEWLTNVDGRSEDALMDLLKKEVLKWSQNCVDVDVLQKKLAHAEEKCTILINKISVLQSQLAKFQMTTRNNYNVADRNMSIIKNGEQTQRLSSNGEDEGISSSERSSSPEEHNQSKPIDNDNDQETTIDDVIEELRIIVEDAEEQDRLGHGVQNIPNQKGTSCKQNLTKSKINDLLSNIDTREIPMSHYILDKQSLLNNYQSISPSNMDGGSLKIVVKGPDVEDAIVPAILYPHPPRRTPCLSTIISKRQGDFSEDPVAFNFQDNDEGEDETVGDGSDSLLSASRLKYSASQNHEDIQEQKLLYLGESGIAEKDLFHEEKEQHKMISNFEAPLKNLQETSPMSSHMDAYRQFESAKTNVYMEQKNSKYKKDPEMTKLLRRSVSHDFFFTSELSTPLARLPETKGEGKIRKFESLNSFDDNSSLKNFNRNSRNGNSEKKTKSDNWSKIRRTESCHHVCSPVRKDSRTGSCNGLHYITNFDLEPVMTRRKAEFSEATQLAKSLDKIDEGLADIVIKGSKQQWIQSRLGREKNYKYSRISDKGIQVKSRGPAKEKSGKKNGTRSGHLKSDQLHIEFYPPALRSDELYKESQSHGNTSANHEVASFDKIDNFADANVSTITTFYQEKGLNKVSVNESGFFLPSGRAYNAFGLRKSRFNAGKYSGNPPPNDGIDVRKNSIASIAVKRGKVTDIISGLY